MRYSTPTVPVYRMRGYATKAKGPGVAYAGKYPVFQLVGFAPGVPVPNPGHVPPKPGHWRTKPGGRMRMAPKPRSTSAAGPMWASTMPRPFAPHTQGGTPNPVPMSTRARVRAAVAAGIIAPEHAPSWAQPQ